MTIDLNAVELEVLRRYPRAVYHLERNYTGGS